MPGLMWPHLQYPRDVGIMAEAQARRWELRQTWPWKALPGACPVVTISRELDDQEPGLGRSLAQRLGFSYWDRELVLDLAGLLDTDTATSVVDERTRRAIATFLEPTLPSQQVVPEDYTDRVHIILVSIVHRGRAVIVGRGAQLLVDPAHALRVDFVASFESCACALETQKRTAFETARHLILSGDRDHALLVLEAMEHDIGDPAQFDVIVNSGTYERERAISLVLMAYFAKFGDWPPTTQALRGAGLVSLRLLPPMLSMMSATRG